MRTSYGPQIRKKRNLMDKILLFPHGCRKIGWGLFVPAALLGVLMLFDGLNGFPSFLLPGTAEAGETLDAVCNNAVIVGLLAGTLLIACSRERIEDEGIGRIRLNALLAALYANCAAVAAAALVTYGAEFLDIMIYNLFTLPLLFLLIFRWQLRRYAKEAADEE